MSNMHSSLWLRGVAETLCIITETRLDPFTSSVEPTWASIWTPSMGAGGEMRSELGILAHTPAEK